MLLTLGAGLMGILLGLWFRVPALIAASMTTAAVFPLFASFAEFSPLSTAATIVALLSALQGGYLVGLFLRVRGREYALSQATTALKRTLFSAVERTQIGAKLRASTARSSQIVHRRT
jgi:hypothetical protein